MAAIGYGYGSEWHLLQYLGRRRKNLTRSVEDLVACSGLTWMDHAEYIEQKTEFLKLKESKGLDFLSESDPVRRDWEQLWPQSGNVHNWDAVGDAAGQGDTTWVLLEAKAHIGELSSSCAATSPDSLDRIRKILSAAQRDLGVDDAGDWTAEYYQYCNRIALLSYLVSHGIDAHLLFLYFTGDRSDLGRTGRVCPASQAAWQEALDLQDRHAGLPRESPLRRRIHRLFLPAYRSTISEEVLRPEYFRREAVGSPPFTVRPPTPVVSSVKDANLAGAFDEAMFGVYRRAKDEVGYNANRFLRMLNEHKGIETARRLLPSMSDGFVALQQSKRLDLTVEYLVLQTKWRELFSEEELEMARARLLACGFTIE